MNPSIKVSLSIPRSGTHFIWSRCISSDEYQLIYDADRIPALIVLSQNYKKKLNFLHPTPPSSNYNFQYNSLEGVEEPLTAQEHLDRLKQKYNATDDFELFKKVLGCQQTNGRQLLVVNRFIYTVSYRFLFEDFIWTIDHAVEALGMLYDWLKRLNIHVDYSMVIRKNPQWLTSYVKMSGQAELSFVNNILDETPKVLDFCFERNIPIFWMKDVIAAMKKGHNHYESELIPLTRKEIAPHWNDADRYKKILSSFNSRADFFRLDRFLEYINEKDAIKRASLVRSIGHLPVGLARRLPIGLGKDIINDLAATALDNASINQ